VIATHEPDALEATYKRVELELPPRLIQSEPIGRLCVGASVVHSIVIPLLFSTIGAPAATAPAVAGTAVPDLLVKAPVTEAEAPVTAPVAATVEEAVTAPVSVVTPVTVKAPGIDTVAPAIKAGS